MKVKRGDKYCIIGHKSGKNLGCYKSSEAADERLKQLKKFKYMLKSGKYKHVFKK